jgi:hypothetical protein|tara:strand:- start:1709 stop:1885 length:177 start_codon:yes stop_codon:yes gene_type:complete
MKKGMKSKGYAKGGMKSKGYAKGGKMKTKGYASGGAVGPTQGQSQFYKRTGKLPTKNS